MNRGFTLVELSIVLVIIGLLIGGILVAQSMISTARIQSQIRQLQQYDILANNFKNAFRQLPGDCSICNHAGTGAGTGNNNRILADSTNTVPPLAVWAEPYYYFIDLYTVGMLAERYQWVNNQIDFGKDKQFPALAIGRGGLIVSGNAAGDVYYATMSTGFQNGQSSYSMIMGTGVLSPAEALAIDVKLDDGDPLAGTAQVTSQTAAASTATIPFTAPTQASNACVNNNVYNTAVTSNTSCRMVIKANLY